MLSHVDNAKDNWKVQIYTMDQPILTKRSRRKESKKVLFLFSDFLVYSGFLVWLPKRVQSGMRHVTEILTIKLGIIILNGTAGLICTQIASSSMNNVTL